MSDVPLIRTSEFEIRGEFLWFGVILHADVYVMWSKGVRKRFLEAMALIRRSIALPLWAFQTPTHDPQKRKFIQDTGGVFHHYRWTPDGEKAEMYLYPPLD
jgi:hypothetical protein